MARGALVPSRHGWVALASLAVAVLSGLSQLPQVLSQTPHQHGSDHGHEDHGHDHGHGQEAAHEHEEAHARGQEVDGGRAHDHGHDHGHAKAIKSGEHHGHDHGPGQKDSVAGTAPRGGLSEAERWFWAYASALGMSVVSFVGVVFLVLLNSPKLSGIVEYACLAFAGTILVADAFVHLLPHALEGADHSMAASVGLSAVLGCMAILVIPEVLEWHGHEHSSGQDDKGKIEAYGYANLVTEMLHNFVDGISLGLAWLSGAPAGFATALAVAVHELPQELGDFMVLRAAGFPVGRLLAWNFLVSLTCVGGVATVHFLGETTAAEEVKRYMTAFTAGSFLSLSLNMIFPQVSASILKRHGGKPRAIALARLLCLVLSFVAVWALVKIGDLEAHEHAHDHGGGHPHDHAHSEL